MSKFKKILLDGDIIVYRSGFACKDDEPVENALHNVKMAITNILDKFQGFEEYHLYLTGSGNFRKDVATIKPYKGNRKPEDRPKYYQEIRDYMINVWNAEVIDGREADDALGCAQWSDPDRSTVIVSIDKDLKMIPGWHYNYVKDTLEDISLQEANRMLFWQMLVGDSSDNIPGIDKIGPKTADKLLPLDGTTESWQRTVVEKYKDQYGSKWKEAYNEVCKLLWMERVHGEDCEYLIW